MPLFLAPPEGVEKILAPAEILWPLITKGALWDMVQFCLPQKKFVLPQQKVF